MKTPYVSGLPLTDAERQPHTPADLAAHMAELRTQTRLTKKKRTYYRTEEQVKAYQEKANTQFPDP